MQQGLLSISCSHFLNKNSFDGEKISKFQFDSEVVHHFTENVFPFSLLVHRLPKLCDPWLPGEQSYFGEIYCFV